MLQKYFTFSMQFTAFVNDMFPGPPWRWELDAMLLGSSDDILTDDSSSDDSISGTEEGKARFFVFYFNCKVNYCVISAPGCAYVKLMSSR